ncbi:MAG: aminopeptidase P family protein [Actinobacteria bacterium]|nr:aminopeptidase P family protein [Actinomycetota bacterium]
MEARIPWHEYEERWRRVKAACAQLGLDGVIVGSRGGAMLDGYADTVYLANHYPDTPLLGHLPPLWVGRGHAFLVFSHDADAPTLIVDSPDWRPDLVAVDDVRYSMNLADEAGRVVDELGLDRGRIGFAGGNQVIATTYLAMCEAIPNAEIVQVPDLVEKLRMVKSPNELELVRESVAVGSEVMNAMMEAAMSQPGITEAEAVAAGYSLAVSRGVAMYDAATSSGPYSDSYSHGRLPSWTTRTLERGDFFHVDAYGALNGYLFDMQRTAVVGGEASEGQLEVLDGLVEAYEAGAAAIEPGVTAGAVYAAVHDSLVGSGMAEHDDAAWASGEGDTGAAVLSYFPCHGHSIGLAWEGPWIMAGNESTFEAGMCISLEVQSGLPGVGTAMFEQDVIVFDDGIETLPTIARYYAGAAGR